MRVAELFFAPLLRSTGGSVLCCFVCFVLPERKREEREGGREDEREREGSVLRRSFNIPLGDSGKKHIYH